MADSKRVLVTGSAGGVGRVVCKQLKASGHRVCGFDLRDAPDVHESVVGDIADREQVRSAMAGMDAVVHLAATPDESDFIEKLLEPNVRGLYNVCDGARVNDVGRVILASSVQVVSGLLGSKVVKLEDGPRIVNHYALTKLWAEQMGEMYARLYGLSVIAARLGWLPRDPAHAEELTASPIGTDVYLSHNDAGRFFTACVEAELTPGQFEILFAASNPLRKARVDLEPARRVVGYIPRDTWPEGHGFDA